MEAIFKLVLITSLYAGIVGIVLIAIKAALKNKINPKWHYLLWIILIMKLVMPFGPESAFSLFNFLEPISKGLDYSLASDGVSNRLQDEFQYLSIEEIAQGNNPNNLPEVGVGVSSLDDGINVKQMLPYIWLLGVILMLAWLFFANDRFTRKLKKNGSPAPSVMIELLTKSKQAAGVKGNIEILIQNIVKTPSLIGVFRPKILLTSDILSLSDREISYILLHELTHYRRKDLLVNYLLLTLQIIHWFNPIIWYCFLKIRQDMEVAADESVLTLLNPSEYKEYGKALLAVLESLSLKTRLAPRLVGMVDDRKNIERRIKMIKMAEFFKSNRRRVILTGIICAVILGGFLWTSASAKADPYEIGGFTVEVPSGWKVGGNENELFFTKDNIPIGGIQILKYYPDQPLPVPNHSEKKSEKVITGLIAKGVLMNLDLTQSAASGDTTVKNENHLLLIFAGSKEIYNIYTDTQYAKESDLIKIGKSLKISPNNLTKKISEDQTKAALKYDVELLLKYKTDYVGDNVKVVHLIDSLPLPYKYSHGEVSLQTEKEPYGVTVNYKIEAQGSAKEEIISAYRKNALVMFALIKNVDVINFNWDLGGEHLQYTATRADLQKSYPRDLREYAKDTTTLELLLRSSDLVLVTGPEKYTPAMSSTPGIKIDTRYNGSADKIRYSVDYGTLITWDSKSGQISEKGKTAEVSFNIPVYWSPLGEDLGKSKDLEISAKVNVTQNNSIVAEKQLKIKYDGSFYYPVTSSPDVISQTTQISAKLQNSIEKAVSQAIKDSGKSYLQGEALTEGHVILEVEEKDGTAIAYTVASVGWFGFENSIFTNISGSGAIPTVIKFSKNELGEYSLLEYKEPMDGAGYVESIKKMFPQRLWDSVLKPDRYPELAQQKEDQAGQYLQSINRSAKVQAGYVEKELVKINVEASNTLFTLNTKRDSELNKFPYWIGTKEYVVNGERFIYETSQSKTTDGYDLITFRKTKEDEKVVVEYQYKIVGNEPVQMVITSVPTIQ